MIFNDMSGLYIVTKYTRLTSSKNLNGQWSINIRIQPIFIYFIIYERGVRAEVCTVSLTRREELQRNHLDLMLRSAVSSLFSDLPGWEESGRRIRSGSGGSRSPGMVQRLGGN